MLLEATPENLTMLRFVLKVSQKEVADMLHLSGASRISDWERGRHPIDPARWELLLIKLNRHPGFKAK